MTDESTPKQPESDAEESPLEVAEKLADSDDPEVLEARTELLKAQTKLTKASIPLFEKIVLRGVIPIALAIITPWALWTFDAAQTEQKKQGETITQLEELLQTAQEEAAARRERMARVEEERAAELASMSAMVVRLDNLLKLILVRDAVSRQIREVRDKPRPGVEPDPIAPLRARADVIRDVQRQLPDLDEEDVRRLAGQQFDRIQEQQQEQR